MPAALVALAAQPEEVTPGGEAVCVVVVRNDSAAADLFAVSVHGPASAWATVDTDTLALEAGDEGSIWIRFRPPEDPMPRAGPVPFSVRVSSELDPSFVAIEAAVVRIGAAGRLEAEFVLPARVTRKSPRQLRVANRGNVATIAGVDISASGGVEVAFASPSVALDPGESIELELLVDVEPRASRRGARDAELHAVITSPEAPPLELRGVIALDPPVGQEIGRAALVLGAALVIVLAGAQLLAPASRGTTAGDVGGLPATSSTGDSDGEAATGEDAEEATDDTEPEDELDPGEGDGDDTVEAVDQPGAPAGVPDGESSPSTTLLTAAVPGMGQVVYARGGDLYVVDAAGSARRLTSGAAHDRMPAVAPDGRALLFVRGGDVHVGGTTSGASRRIVVGALWPVWSSDGTRMAYVQNGRIKVAAADGTGAVDTAATPDGRISWGGDRIVYSADGDLWAIDPAGGDPVRLTSAAASELEPAVSPDGESVAYISGGGVWVLDKSGSANRLTAGPTDGPAAWSPDGSRIVFRRGSDSYLHVTGLDGRDAGRIESASVADVDAPAWGAAVEE